MAKKTIHFRTKPLEIEDCRLNREINKANLKKAPNIETGDWWDNSEDIKKAGGV